MTTNTAGSLPIDFHTPPDNGEGIVIVAPAIVVHCVPSLRMVMSVTGDVSADHGGDARSIHVHVE